MQFRKKGPAAQPKPSRYDGMGDAEFVDWLEAQSQVESGEYPAVERRVNKLQGVFYQRASQLLLSRSSHREQRATDKSF